MSGQAKRHGRRAIRSSLSGPELPNPDSRVTRFELDARSALEALRALLPADLAGVKIGFSTVPGDEVRNINAQSEHPVLYSVDRKARSIVLYRMPIQRARGLHVDDAEHRRYFVGHCLYLAVCEYLGRDPWELLPGRFDHF